MPLTTGQTLKDRYRIERLLGEGGFGAVYLAWDLNLDGAVAVKENAEPAEGSALGKTPGGDQSAIRQFQLEAKILFQLRHPNLPRVSDFFTIPGQGQYLVMDYIEGEDLGMMLERAGGPLPYERALAWIIQVCDALSYLHTQEPPIIHRDIKPANIRITRTTSSPLGQAILVDFGIAKLYNPSTNTTVGARAVTLNYSPPEQYGLGKTDAQSDLYALGATAYHMLTGVTPAPAVDIMSGNVPPPIPVHQINSHVSPAVSAAIAKAMQIHRQARFSSVHDFAVALRLAQTGISVGGDVPIAPPESTVVQPPAIRSEAIPTASYAVQDPFATAMVQPETQEGVKLTFQAQVDRGQPATEAEKPAKKPFWRRKVFIFIAIPLCLICGLFVLLNIDRNGERPLTPRQESATALAGGAGAPESTPTGETTATLPPTEEPMTRPATGTGLPAPTHPASEAEFAYPQALIGLDNIDHLTQLARWGDGTLNMIALSADGRLLAAASSLGIYLYDAATLEMIDFIDTELYIDRLSLSPDGTLLAAVSWETNVKVWSLADVDRNGCPEGGCPLLYTLEGHEDSVNDVTFASDGRILASASGDGSIRLWNMENGKQIEARVAAMVAHEDGARTVAFSPDDSLIASGDGAGTLRLWAARTGELLQELRVHDGQVVSLAISPNGAFMASVGVDETVKMIAIAGPDEGYALSVQYTLPGAGETAYTDAAFTPDGEILSVTDWEGRVRLWKTASGEEVATLDSETIGLSSQVFYPMESQAAGLTGADALLTSSYDGAIILWNYRTGEAVRTRWDQGPAVNCVAFSPAGAGFAVGLDDGGVLFYSPTSSQALWEGYEHEYTVNDVAFSANGSLLASAGNDQMIRLWNPKDGSLIKEIEMEESIYSLAFSPTRVSEDQPGFLAAGLESGKIIVWQVERGAGVRMLATLDAHSDTVTSLSFTGDSALLISGSMDGFVRAWSLADGSLNLELAAGPPSVGGLAIAPDSQRLAASYSDSSIHIWHEGADTAILSTESGSLNTLAYSPDGQVLAVAADWSRVILWNPLDGSLLRIIYDHTSVVSDLAFSPDGHLLVTVSHDGTIRIYGVP